MTLYNSFGERLAIVENNRLYSKRGKHIGIIHDNMNVYNLKGKYLGTITDNNRFYYFSNKRIISISSSPRFPSIPIPPTEPKLWSTWLPVGAENIDESLLE